MAAIQFTVVLLFSLLIIGNCQQSSDDRRIRRLEHQLATQQSKLNSLAFELEDTKEQAHKLYTSEKQRLEDHLVQQDGRIAALEATNRTQVNEETCQRCTAELRGKVVTLEDRMIRLNESCNKDWSPPENEPPPREGLLVISGDFHGDRRVDLYDVQRNVWIPPRQMMPRKNARFGAVRVVSPESGDQLIYTCGGYQKECWTYNLKHDRWTDNVTASLQKDRSRFDLVTGEGYMYAVGGMEEDTIERYSFEHNNWTVVAQLPQVSDPEAGQMIPQQRVASTSVGGWIYMFGFGLYNDGMFWRYDPKGDKITRLADCPKSRAEYYLKPSLMAVKRGTLGRKQRSDLIYVVSERTDVVYRYDVQGNVWEAAAMRIKDEGVARLRDRSAAIARSGAGEVSLYLMGGYLPRYGEPLRWEEHAGTSSRVERLVLRLDLDEQAKEWEAMADMPQPRGQFGQIVNVFESRM